MTTPLVSPACAAALPNEAARLDALRAYGILDTVPEAAFDDIARLAALVCGTPIATVTLIDAERQWYKAEVGIGFRETPRSFSFCAHAILQPGLVEVPDMRLDPRFANHPAVAGEPGVRFYAGAVLQTPDGLPLGTVCVMDTQPRQLDESQREALLALARQTMAQLELRRALRVAERAQRWRGRLMAVAGHDLKQPLQILTGVLDRIGRRELDARDRAWLQLAHSQARRMNEELDELAIASGLDGAVLPEMQTIEVGAALTPMLDGWRMAAERKGLRFRSVLGSPKVVTDPRMLTTMVSNLVANAIKYTERGGVLIGARRQGRAVNLLVVDTGPGIAPAQHEAIFEAFRQLNPEQEGLGLGLSIVRQTAELLSCPIQLRSTPGRGSAFAIHLPRAD